MFWLSKLFEMAKEKSSNDWLPHSAINAVNLDVVVDLSQLLPGLLKLPKLWIPEVPSAGSMLPNFSRVQYYSGGSSEDGLSIP